MRLCDCHNHVQLAAQGPGGAGSGKGAAAGFGPRLEGMLRRAKEAGVEMMLCCGTEPADWPAVAALAKAEPTVFPCFGVHPWYAKSAVGDWLSTLEKFLLELPSAVGEIGLDRTAKPVGTVSRREALDQQEDIFTKQLGMAGRLRRPAMIHCLRTWDRLLAILRQRPSPAPFLLHSYSGSAEMVPELAALGAYFSFGGGVGDPRREKVRKALLAVPQDRLLLETDAPPEDEACTDWYAEPAGVKTVLGRAAGVLGKPPAELADQVWDNLQRFLTGKRGVPA